jgi:hypothetical protein
MVQRRDFVTGAGAVVANCVSSRFAFGQAVHGTSNAGAMPPPSRGLRSNSNYFLYNGGKPITGLSVVVDVMKDIVAPGGFTIQLNAYSPPKAVCVFQQYVMGLYRNPSAFGWTIETFLSDAYSQHLHDTIGLGTGTGNQVMIQKRLSLLPGNGFTIPTGYKFTIILAYNPKDASGAIIGATYSVTDNHGKSQSTGLQRIQSYRFNGTKSSIPIPAEALAPIVAFQLNIVAAANISFLVSGAGTITYSATSPLTVVSKHPAGTAAEGVGTAEQANTAYGELEAGPSRQFIQTFEAAQTPKFGPGGAFAVSQRFGTSETALFAISLSGQLVMFTVDRFARWKQSPGYGPVNMADPYSPIAVSQRFGVNGQTGVFLLNQDGQLLVFWVDANGVTGPSPPLGDKHLAPYFGALAASQQFGADQTDVFLFDNHGQLNVFSAQGGGALNGPVKIGPTGFARSGAQLAASQRFGINQTDVFVVDKTGALSDYRVVGTDNWKDPAKISQASFANSGAHIAAGQRAGSPNQLDVFLVDKNGQLNVFSNILGKSSWDGPLAIGPKGLADAGAPVAVSQRFGAVQTDVFVVDKKGTLNVISVDGTGIWKAPKQLGPPGLAPSGAFVAASPQYGISNQTDVFLINQTGSNGPGWPMVFWVDAPSDSWNGPKALVIEV